MSTFNFQPAKPVWKERRILPDPRPEQSRAVRRGLSGDGGPRRWRKRRVAARLAGKVWGE